MHLTTDTGDTEVGADSSPRKSLGASPGKSYRAVKKKRSVSS